MGQKIGIAIVGAGRIGRVHAENLAYRIPETKLIAVADPRVEAAGRLAADYHVPHVLDDSEACMRLHGVDAVVICSSTDTHASLIEAAARAGRHIFCEKPIALDIPSIDRALEAVDRAGVKVQVGFNRRFDPSFRRARDMVAEGRIGTPHIVRITSRDPQPPPIEYVKVSGGIFLDMAIHDFDMVRYLVGSEVRDVFAVGTVLVDERIGRAGDFDTAITTLRFSNGTLGTIDNSRQAVYGYDQRVEVFGSKGAVLVGNRTPDSAVLSDVNGVHAAMPLYFFVERYTESYLNEMRAFVHCIVNDKTPPVTGFDGRMPVVIGHAASRSCREGRPVALAEIEGSESKKGTEQ